MTKKYHYKTKTGRPTKYNSTMIDMARKYIEDNVPENMSIPTIEGLALLLGVDDTTLLNWGANNPEFFAIIKDLKQAQKKHLMITGLFGGKEINSTMAIFLLKVNHGMVETEHIQHSGDFNINIDELIGLTKTSTQTTDSSSDSV